MRTWITYLLLALVLLASACAGSDKKSIYTEEGLRAAEQGWDGYYNTEADRCESLHEPKTPQMEACLGATYDADAVVAKVVQAAVAILRGYWIARAQGEDPDFAAVFKQIQALIDDLPPEAKTYFHRVKGIP